MAVKKTQKTDTTVQPTTEAKQDTRVTRVTFDINKIKQKYGFMPSSLYVSGKVVTPDNLTFELPTELVANIQDLIEG